MKISWQLAVRIKIYRYRLAYGTVQKGVLSVVLDSKKQSDSEKQSKCYGITLNFGSIGIRYSLFSDRMYTRINYM